MANLIMILHEIQNRHGFVPRSASLLLSDLLEIPLARIYEVLTFYHYFKLVPPGKTRPHRVQRHGVLPEGIGRLLGELETRLGIRDGDTTEDRLFHNRDGALQSAVADVSSSDDRRWKDHVGTNSVLRMWSYN